MVASLPLPPARLNDAWPASIARLWGQGASPTSGEIRALVGPLTAYRNLLALHMVPASRQEIGRHLMRLNVHYGTRDMAENAWQSMFVDYIDLLGQYPSDIWQRGIDAMLLKHKFLPTISELNEVMAELFESRAIRLRAANRLLSKAA